MEARRKDQPVSITLAIAGPANPRARDPPSHRPAAHLPVQPKRRERRCANIASPQSRTPKLIQLQIATLPGDSPSAYPQVPPIWPVLVTGKPAVGPGQEP